MDLSLLELSGKHILHLKLLLRLFFNFRAVSIPSETANIRWLTYCFFFNYYMIPFSFLGQDYATRFWNMLLGFQN
jgi:hypothetical protein